MKVGLYARVSTKDKEQNPENQLIKLREYCKVRDWDYEEYVDYASGAKNDRPGLRRIMGDLDSMDGIIVLRLDRFGRSIHNLIEQFDIIRAKGKFFEAIDQGLKISDKKDPMSDFILVVLGAAAEFERQLMSERVKDGMARAKLEHKKIGRPKVMDQKGIELSELQNLHDRGKSIRQISQLLGIKRSTVHAMIKKLPSENPTVKNQ